MTHRFNPEATCPKCAGTEIGAHWNSGRTYPVYRRDPHRDVYIQFMERRCVRCRYVWREECLDTPEEELPA
jgi:hypothetical protein